MIKNIDINAPIIPYEGLGGIKLYSTIRDFKEIIKDKDGFISEDEVIAEVQHNDWIRYEIKGIMYLFFHLCNGKLFKITTLRGYKGKLFGSISVDSTEEEFLKIEPTFVYDDFEEVFETPKGAFIMTDPITTKATWISVFIKEIDDDDFDEANW